MKILLGVTGSISCYKTFDLLRLLVKEDHQVKVILSQGAEAFIRPELFRYLGAQEVYSSSDDFNMNHYKQGDSNVLHVEMTKWADKLVLAPLSANTLADITRGQCRDLLQSVFLAWPRHKEILAFPAMNTGMLNHPFTQDNLDKLESLPNLYLAPTQEGELACGDIGEGKLLDIESIFHLIECYTVPKTSPRKVLISTGATVAPLDPVRYLTNASSGKTGFHLAKVALSLGHSVVVVAGIHSTRALDLLQPHPNFELYKITTHQEMHQHIDRFFPSCDHYISSAAIGDIEFTPMDSKMKKNSIDHSLKIKKTADILADMISKKENQSIVGFAAETNLDDDVLREKLIKKPVSLLVATQVHSGLDGRARTQGFQNDSAHYRLCSNDVFGAPEVLSKKDLAVKIFSALGTM